MKTSTNVFLDGLTTDMHPLTTRNNLLTDALNATLRTFNGNELVLQNDMGNTLIQDSTTGNIMGLRDGFVPVGMKEYGGILYIASYNPTTKEGQLGTIPSPLITYNYDSLPYISTFAEDYESLTNIDKSKKSNSLINTALPKYLTTPFLISSKRFQVGDQFIVNLNIEDDFITLRNCFNTEAKKEEHSYGFITGFRDDDIKDYGWFKVVLEAKVERSNETLILNSISDKRQVYYTESSLDPITSKYWFINERDTQDLLVTAEDGTEYLPLDTERCLADDRYRTYPNILPGYLYVHIEAELPDGFLFFKNTTTGIKSPNMYIISKNDEVTS